VSRPYQRMTAARARAIVDDNDEREGIARIVAEAPEPPSAAIELIRDDLPVGSGCSPTTSSPGGVPVPSVSRTAGGRAGDDGWSSPDRPSRGVHPVASSADAPGAATHGEAL
jgi:hypothetical protein